MGFRAEVENFQPYYIFGASQRNWDALRIGASVLKETVDKIKLKEEQQRLNWVDPKAVQREIAMKVGFISIAIPVTYSPLQCHNFMTAPTFSNPEYNQCMMTDGYP